MKNRYFVLLLLAGGFFTSCADKEQVEYEQYLVNGEEIYLQHCANCHGEKGEGLRNLYPALAKNEGLKSTDKIICLIKNGISADRAKSNQAMPGNKELYDLDLASLHTFLLNRFLDSKEKVSVEDVKKALNGCN